MNLKYLLFTFVLLTHQMSFAYYLYAENDISVRVNSSPQSKEFYKIKTGETFEVIKWNNFNTRIRLKDGRIGFIDKSHVAAYAPDNNTGYPVNSISFTTTKDKNDMYKQRPGISLDYKAATSNAESPSAQTDMEEDIVNNENDIVDYDQQTSGYKEEAKYSTNQLVEKLANEAWSEAIETRNVARYLGGGRRGGNSSKGMCAQAVKEALVDAGICHTYPSGDARNLHTTGELRRDCPKLKLAKSASARNKLDITDISQAPAGSVIVYSGYAGKKPHNYGHIEIKVPVTPELKTKMGRDGLSVQVGQFVYCSDFCRATPTKKSTNSVIGIYTL